MGKYLFSSIIDLAEKDLLMIEYTESKQEVKNSSLNCWYFRECSSKHAACLVVAAILETVMNAHGKIVYRQLK